MSVFRIKVNAYNKLPKLRYFSSGLNESEYTSTPQYPPILDMSFEKRLERKKEAVHEKIKAVKTIEEKQIKLNMPRYYGFKTHLFTEDRIPYNSLPLSQHITRTHLIINNELPEFYKNIQVDEDVKQLKTNIEELILMELEGYRKSHDIKGNELTPAQIDDFMSFSVSRQINKTIINHLATNYKHLVDIQVDYNPRIESTWAVGGIAPPKNVKRIRENLEWMKHLADEPVNRMMTYIGTPNLILRSKFPLNIIVSPSEAENPALDVPFFKYDPVSIGGMTQHRHIANIPGFWPGDQHQFGCLSFHKRGHLFAREHFKDIQDDKEALHSQALVASFGWLHAQANFLGFTTYNDITYPLITQTIISNGKTYSFYVYQMNTMLLHSKYINENPKRNICWATDELNLYENIVDGKIIGFNDDVLVKLVKFYANAPEERLGINMRPYLSDQEKVISDYQDDDKRQWLEKEYKYLMSNIPRFKEADEIYHWEKLYKVDHETRPQEKRSRFFEIGVNPYARRLDERQPYYIPRAQRPHLPRWKGRYMKEYFP